MNSKVFKSLMLGIVLICMIGVNFLQKEINIKRGELGLTRLEVLENAPPMLAFTTVALGGFRGLIANVLWIRMTDLGDQGRYFETIQLADWITKLEPTFAPVWNWQAWNLAYNISIKFNDPRQRWHWVNSGIKLLRDEGLVYNPDRASMYRELSWFFQHKIGYYLDDYHMYYKTFWAQEMESLLGETMPLNWEKVLNPQTDDEKENVRRLKEEYKLDPQFMKKVDDKFGPLDWRLAEVHAIYWAMLGMEKSRKGDDLMPLQRSIYQPMLINFHRGRLITNPFNNTYEYRPNLDAIPNTDKAYLEFAEKDEVNRAHILSAHKNFLKDAIYFLYSYNRISEAANYFREFAERYPDQNLLSGDPTSTPDKIALDEFVVERVEEDVRDNSPDRVRGIIDGLLFSSFYALALSQEDEATGNAAMALKIWQKYQNEVNDTVSEERIGLPDFQSMRRSALEQFLQIADEREPLMGDALRVRLNLPKRDETSSGTQANEEQTSSPAQEINRGGSSTGTSSSTNKTSTSTMSPVVANTPER